jgi:hypothetical protein
MDETWWVCEACNSLNRKRARKCYSCGTKLDTYAPAETHKPFDGVTIVRVTKADTPPLPPPPEPVVIPPGQEWDLPEPALELEAEAEPEPEPVVPPVAAAPAPRRRWYREPALDRPFGRLSRVWTLVAIASVVAFWIVVAIPKP